MGRRRRSNNLMIYLFIIAFAGVIAIQVFNSFVGWIQSITLGNTLNYIYNNSGVLAVAMLFTLLLFGLRYLMSDKIKEWENQQRQQCLAKEIDINDMLKAFNGIQFEHYVAKVFECLGYKTEVTKASGDRGKDIILWKDDKKYVAEVKLFNPENTIGTGYIQKLHSAKGLEDADDAFFITTSDFKKTVPPLAQECGIKLINGEKFKEMIAEVMMNENTDLDSLNEITSIFNRRGVV